MTEIEKSRIEFIDLLKALAIFLVITYHSIDKPELNGAQNILYGYFSYFLFGTMTVCVPLFLVAHGFLMLGRPLDIKTLIFRALNILLLAISWSAITVIIAKIGIKDINLEGGTLHAIASHSVHGVNNHLWYLFALFGIYVFYPIINLAFMHKNKDIILYLLIILFIITFGGGFVNWAKNIFLILFISGSTPKPQSDYMSIIGFGFFSNFSWTLVYFIIGGILKDRSHKIPASISVTLFLGSATALFLYGAIIPRFPSNIFFDTVWNGYNSIPGLIMTICGFVFLRDHVKFNAKFNRVVSVISKNTLGIYFIHYVLISLSRPTFNSSNLSNIPAVILIYSALILIVSCAISIVCRPIPFVGRLFRI